MRRSGEERRKSRGDPDDLRKQAIIAAAIAAALTGCGGAGSSDNSTSTSATNTTTVTDATTDATTNATANAGPTGAQVLLKSTPGQLELAFLTGQARNPTAPGDVEAQIGRVTLQDSLGQTVDPGLQALPALALNNYTNSVVRTNSTVLPQDARLFTQAEIALTRLTRTDFSGTQTLITQIGNFPVQLPIEANVFPNRFTLVPVNLNDAQFQINEPSDPTEPTTATFLRSQFNLDNGLGTGLRQRLPSSLSDYLRFDVRGIPEGDLPKASDGGAVDYVLFSGDNYAVAANRTRTGVSGLSGRVFDAVNLNNFDPADGDERLIKGAWKPDEIVVEPGGQINRFPGSYDLRQRNPLFDPSVLFVTSVQGIFRDFGAMFSGIGDVQAISFPNSLDNNRQDFVVASSTAGSGTERTVSAMVFGFIDFSNNSVHVFPLRNLTTASASGEVVGTISNLLNVNGTPTRNVASVRYGTWNANIPGIGASTGIFTVYRK